MSVAALPSCRGAAATEAVADRRDRAGAEAEAVFVACSATA